MKVLICPECKGDTFQIVRRGSCEDCHENIASCIDDGGYIEDNERIEREGLHRDHVENEGECNLGTAFGVGCLLYTCMNKCWFDYLPMCNE